MPDESLLSKEKVRQVYEVAVFDGEMSSFFLIVGISDNSS